MILLASQNIPKVIHRHIKLFNLCLAFQILISISSCWYGIFSFSPSFISMEKRVTVMNNLAEGYSLMSWIDQVLPEDAVILSQHRALALSKRKSISLDWMKHSELNKLEILPYLEIIRNKKPTHLVLISKKNKLPEYYNFFSECVSKETIQSRHIRAAARNPFNRGKMYTAHIYSLNSNILPGCFKGISKTIKEENKPL